MEVRERYRQHYGRIRDKRIREEKVAEDIRGRRKTSMDPAHYRMDGVAWAWPNGGMVNANANAHARLYNSKPGCAREDLFQVIPTDRL